MDIPRLQCTSRAHQNPSRNRAPAGGVTRDGPTVTPSRRHLRNWSECPIEAADRDNLAGIVNR